MTELLQAAKELRDDLLLRRKINGDDAVPVSNGTWQYFNSAIEKSARSQNIYLRALTEIIAECAQENCDGDPWDTFQKIAINAIDEAGNG